MSGTWDADVTLVHAAAEGGTDPLDTVAAGQPFDVVASVRVGRNLMQFVDAYDLFVSVRNLSRSSIVDRCHQSCPLAPQDAPLHRQLRVAIPAGWTATEGDLLELLATFKVTAGINADYTLARSAPLIVTA
jgi:hypothetical protein